MHVVKAELGFRSYDILIGARLEQLGGEMAKLRIGDKAAVVTNPTVRPLYGQRVIDSMKSPAG